MVGKHGGCDEYIALYEQSLMKDATRIAALEELCGLVLGCWCAPRACHGDLLVRLVGAIRGGC